LNHGTRPNDQQAADRPFTAFRNGTKFLLATGRFLQRRQSEPGREIAAGNPSPAGASAVIAVETIGPTPGIVINRRAVGSDFERWLISPSKAAICASNAVKVSTGSFRMMRTLSGSEDCRSSTRATRVQHGSTNAADAIIALSSTIKRMIQELGLVLVAVLIFSARKLIHSVEIVGPSNRKYSVKSRVRHRPGPARRQTPHHLSRCFGPIQVDPAIVAFCKSPVIFFTPRS
jgi:hypothetical protein